MAVFSDTVFPERFIQELSEDNYWWSRGTLKQDPPLFKRSDLRHYIEGIEKGRVDVVIGARRVGKTTLISQIIEHLLKVKKVDPRTIFFVSLERPYLELTQQKLETAISFYEDRVLGMSIADSSKLIYLFIDEAQYDKSWPRTLKQFVDQKRPIYALVSGSSSTAVFRDSESGVGRFNVHHMVTMKLRDTLRFAHMEDSDFIYETSYALRNALICMCRTKNSRAYEKAVSEAVASPLSRSFSSGMEDYLLKGGYPEFYATEHSWPEISLYYQQNVFDLILQKDVVNEFPIKYPDKIRALLVTIVSNTAFKLTRKKLTESIGLTNARTVDEYVDALCQAFLIRVSAAFKARGYPSTKEKKFYAADTGLRNAVLGVRKENISHAERGQLLETAIFNHALRLAFHVDHKLRTSGHYWEVSKAEERDIILDFRDSFGFVLPIEVKNGRAGDEDIRRIRGTTSRLGSPFGIIICEGKVGAVGNVLLLPAWAFMLSC